MKNFWKIVNDVIRRSDIIIMILDARMYKESRNPEIEDKILEQGKRLLYVINKSDLVSPKELNKIKLSPSVSISAKFHTGNIKLLQKLLRMAAGKDTVVGVLGYPNCGKSTVINALKGRSSARTSRISGYTKSYQNIRIAPNLLLIDTPGVFPYKEKDDVKHSLLGAKDPDSEKDPEDVVMHILAEKKGVIEQFFEVPILTDLEQTLEMIALKKKILVKGGQPDTRRMAKRILDLIHKGKIRTS